MRKLFYGAAALAVFIGFTSMIISCGSSSSPSSPAATPTPGAPTATPTPGVPTATSTPSMPTQVATISLSSFVPRAVRVAANGNLWVLQYNSPGTLEQVTTSGAVVGSAITSANGTPFAYPEGLAVDPVSGEVYVADYQNKQTESFNSSGTWLATFNPSGYYEEGIGINSAGTTVYIENDGTYTYQAYSIVQPSTYTRQSAADMGAGTPGGKALSYPGNSCFDSSGNFWVSDSVNSRLVEFSGTGTYVQAVTIPSSGIPSDVQVDHSGNVFAADKHNGVVVEFNAAGQFLYSFGSLGTVTGISLDSTGNYLYAVDNFNSQIYVFKIH